MALPIKNNYYTTPYYTSLSFFVTTVGFVFLCFWLLKLVYSYNGVRYIHCICDVTIAYEQHVASHRKHAMYTSKIINSPFTWTIEFTCLCYVVYINVF